MFALKQIKNGQATFKAKVTNLDTKQHAYAYNDYGGVYTEDAAFEQDYIQGIINSGAMPDRVEQPNDALIPGAKVTASTQTVTVAAGESKTIEFTLSLPQTATQEFVEGFVALKALDGAHDLIAPYMGYAGDFGKGSQTVSSAEFGTLAFLDGAEKVHTPNENGVIAFSPANPASNFRQAGLYATSNHSIDECSVSIEDADHKHVIDVDKSYYLRKGDIPFAAWNGQTYNQATGKYTRAKDGNYHYVVKTKTLFQTEPEVRDVDLTIDSVAPTVSNTQVIQMPRDKDTALAQELLAAGKIQDTGVFVAGQINDAVGFDSVVNLVIETEEFSSTRQLGKGKGNNFVIQLRNGEDTLIEGTQGKQNIAVGVTDSAGNYGEEVTTFQSGSGVNFYNAKDNAMTPLVADTPGYNATTNKLTLYGSYTPQNTGDELYVDNQKITVDVDAEFAITVDAPALGAKRKVYLTNTPYTDEADALNKAIGYTELYTVDYQLATTLDVDQKFTTSDTLISSKRGTIPAKKIEGTVYDPSIRVTGHSTDANWTDLDNSLTQNNFTRQFNTADFKADVPLYDGLNMIVATANNTYADLGLMVQKYGIYAVHAKSEPVQFDKLKTNVTNQYNAVTAPAAGYDQATGEFTITGITNDLDLEDFIIFGHSNDANDPANQVTVNRNGTFTYKFAIDQDATKTLRYRYTLGTETFNRDLKINLSQSLPVLNFDNTDKWVETANGYEVWTNQDQFTVSGTAQTTKDILEIDINDAIVARKEYLYNGDRNEVVKYTKTIDLEKAADGTAKDTIVKIAYADYKADGHAENGNVANKTITVHRLKTTLAQPSVKQVADKCGKVTLNATAPVDTTVQWSVDGKTWNAYNEQAGVSTNANTTIQFKAVDKYGNSSAIVKYVVNNAQPITIAKPTLCTQKLTKTTATLLFNIGKQTKPMQQLKLEISLNNGKTWQTQNAAQPVVLHKTQIISARVKAQNGATSAVATWYVQLGQHPKVTNLK
ncbi:MAG: Fn3-like domain-containing protein [Lactobacillaceae bacterium]|nr:Fn3-like domain-containing protein [Lactobacillaceae bacterium]